MMVTEQLVGFHWEIPILGGIFQYYVGEVKGRLSAPDGRAD